MICHTSISLDIAAADGYLLDMLVAITAAFPSITYRVESLEGPAGWPLVRFDGDKGDIRDFVVDYCAGDLKQAYELLMA